MTSSENETDGDVAAGAAGAAAAVAHARSGRSCRSRPAGSRWTRCCRSPTSSIRRRARSRRPCSSRLAELGYFGITVPAEAGRPRASASSSTAWSARSWPAPGCRRPASWPARRGWARRWPTPTAGTSCWPAARAATGSARSRCPSPTPAPTWPGSPPAPSWTATSGSSPGTSAGAATRRPPTSSRCWCASATRSRGSPGRRGWSTCCWRRSAGEFPEGLTGHPIDKVGYHGFLTWDLRFDGVRIPKDNVIDQARAAQEDSAEEGEAAEQAGLRRGAEVPQHRPGAHRGPRRGAGPGRAGGLDPLPAGARAVRPPDRRLPGAAVRRRRDGRADRAVPGLLPAGRAPARPRAARARRRPRW